MILLLIALATMVVVETLDAAIAEIVGWTLSPAMLWLLHIATAMGLSVYLVESPIVGLAAAGLAVAIGVVMKRISVMVPPRT